MNDALLILHLFGLGAAFTSAFGAFFVGVVTNSGLPEDAPALARMQPALARFGDAGLAILLITGPLMLWLKWGWTAPDPTMFGLKMLFVVLLVAMIVVIRINARRAFRDKDMVAFGRLAIFGRVATTFLLLVLVFAVLTFE
jgi:uncharacterized membrane protein